VAATFLATQIDDPSRDAAKKHITPLRLEEQGLCVAVEQVTDSSVEPGVVQNAKIFESQLEIKRCVHGQATVKFLKASTVFEHHKRIDE
jgi:hypothetical protein